MKKLLNNFPFISFPAAMFIFRLALAAVFLGHAGMRLWVPGYFNSAAALLESRGLPFALAAAWFATLFELIGAPLLIFNKFSRWVALGFFLISAASMALVQSRVGWWVAEYGDGGMEFSFIVCAMCLFVAAVDREQQLQNTSSQQKISPLDGQALRSKS